MTRTFCTGDPSPIAEMVDVVAEAQRAGVAAVRPVWRPRGRRPPEVIADAGWGDAFMHPPATVLVSRSTNPRVASTVTPVAQGHVVTVEPGVYLEPGGVRIEDTVVVTDDGCHPLTHTESQRSETPNI